MRCKQCSTQVHYCSCCDREAVLDHGYCSEKCFEQSQEFYDALLLRKSLLLLIDGTDISRDDLNRILDTMTDFVYLLDEKLDI